ncbi:MAG: hypothetical protein NTU60_06495 [Candidatus Aminicenantes bacterium]|nr:hypothetical protein [Candidatus Aminicenantes bacterium]
MKILSKARSRWFLFPVVLSAVVVFASSLPSDVQTSAARPQKISAEIGLSPAKLEPEAEKRTLAASLKPDLTMSGSLIIGKNKKQFNWGGAITLGPEDASSVTPDHRACFDIYYSLRENNGLGASGFMTRINFSSGGGADNGPLALGPRETKEIHTQPYLTLREGKLRFDIDADNSVEESREDNNSFVVVIKFRGF